MQVTKSQKRLLLILALVILYAIYDFSTAEKSNTVSRESASMVKPSRLLKTTAPALKVKNNLKMDESINWKRDPFQRHLSQNKKHIQKRPNFKINAIMQTSNGFSAMVNQQVLTEGQYILGYKVESISESKVKMSGPQGSFYLNLN